ncbi:4Fe-4S binding protein [Chloroflexota bacterium]
MKVFRSAITSSPTPQLIKNGIRLIFAILISLSVLLIWEQPVAACTITITPDSASGNVGDTITFTIDVQKTHRTCLIPIDETEINLRGMEIVSQSLWKAVSSEIHRKEITVRLTEVGEGLIEVSRECSKGGGFGSATVTIQGKVGTSIPKPPELEHPIPTPSTEQTPAPTEPELPTPVLPSTPSPTPIAIEPSWGESFKNGMMQPDIIAVLALTVLGTVALMRRYRRFRYLILLASMSYLGFILGGHPGAFGAIQNIILRIEEVKERLPSYLLLGIPVMTAILFGRIFCGWVCPMGAVQNFVYKKETGKKGKHFDISPRLHNILRYGKYAVLVALVIATLMTRTNWGHVIDPFKALFNIQLELIPTSILVVLLAYALVVSFPWCKYVCPLGAFLSLFSKFTLFKVKIGDKCNNCKACHTIFCDYKAIKPGEMKPEINQLECTRCGECISRCPHAAMELTVHR